jgi:Domain of unknown function (DUF4333)
MRLLARLGVLLGVLAALVLATGCGGTVLDTSDTEETIKQSIEDSRKEKVSSVDCPSDQKVEAGATFTCSIKLSSGKEETATLKIRNEDADLSVIKISGGNE